MNPKKYTASNEKLLFKNLLNDKSRILANAKYINKHQRTIK